MTFSRTFVVSALVAFGVAVPALAAAKYQRYSGAFCGFSNLNNLTSFRDPSLLDNISGIPGTGNHGLTALDNGTTRTDLVCPIMDTDYLDHIFMKTVFVHGHAGAASDLKAKACWTSWNANNGNCTAPQNAAGSYPNQFVSFTNPSGVFSGATGSDFVYVFVSLAKDAAVRGYFVQDS